jgi:general secretion pathway protein D
MFARLILSCVAAVTLLAAGAFAQAPVPNLHKHKHHAKMVLRVYQIADLIVPLENSGTKNMLGLAPAPEPVKPAFTDYWVTPTYVAPQTPAPARAYVPYDINAVAARLDGEPASPKPREIPVCKPTPDQPMADQLIKLIARAIAPQSWQENGGKGTMDYHPFTMALVVKQTPAVQERIESFLAELRRLQELDVAVEVRVISVDENYLGGVRFEFSVIKPGEEPQRLEQKEIPGNVVDVINSISTPIMNDAQVRQFMEAIEGDQRTNVMQAPKMTLANGQKATMGISETQFFVTHIDAVKNDGKVLFVPRNEALSTGVSISLQPVVSQDRRSVNLALKFNMTGLTSDKVPLVPVVMPIVPKDADGKDQKPVAFTQYLQQPAFETLTLEKTLNIPDGGTVLMGGWKRTRTVRHECSPPGICKCPWIKRLFTNVGYGKETETVLLMVTPRIVESAPKEAVPPNSCPTPEPIPMPKPVRTQARYMSLTEAIDVALERATPGIIVVNGTVVVPNGPIPKLRPYPTPSTPSTTGEINAPAACPTPEPIPMPKPVHSIR